MMSLALTLALMVQAPPQSGPVAPVLAFPEPGVDDPAAYRGYQTRFYRDSHRNTVQIYLEPRAARTTLVWADAANESAGFTTRDAQGRAASLAWDGRDAIVSDSAGFRGIEYGLVARVPAVTLGWVVLGSMRVERAHVGRAAREILRARNLRRGRVRPRWTMFAGKRSD